MAVAMQEGITDSLINYYDFMIVGKTGMGKSTTADKLLMANPTGLNYVGGQQQEVDVQDGRVKAEDISMWILSEQEFEEERVRTRVKNLAFYRSLSNSLEEVNQARAAGMHAFDRTKDCELLSNETTKVRVLDVPGFFDGDSFQKSNTLDNDNLEIMRKILHIQAAMRMKFRRLLYFLPVKGTLTRNDAILQLELRWMSHYFGNAVLGSMVLVATIPDYISKRPELADDIKCPKEELEKTKVVFMEAMNAIFPGAPDECPPMIFISLSDSCETILRKVKEAQVKNQDGLELECDRNVCVDCGMKSKEIRGVKVACYFTNESETIPYDESKCHPCLVPKFSSKMKHRFLSIFRRSPGLRGEFCIGCNQGPNAPGCMRVGSKMKRKLRKNIIVDHTNTLIIDEDDEEQQEGEVVPPQENQQNEGEIPGEDQQGHTQDIADYSNPVYHSLHAQGGSRQPLETSQGPTQREPTSSYNRFNEEQKGT